MGRIGITYSEVAQAATTIMQQGQRPTIDGVRECLGTGSKTTISAHLRQWKHENEGEIVLTRTSLPPELLSIVQGLWDGIKNANEAEIEAIKTKHREEKQQLISTLDEFKQQIESKEGKIKSYQEVQKEFSEKNTSLQDSHEKQGQKLKETEGKLTIKSVKLQEKEQYAQSQQRQIEQAFANLEHFRAATQEQRQQEQLQADQQRQELQSQIKSLYADLHNANTQLSQIKVQYQSLEQRNSFLADEKQYLEDQQAKRALEYQTALNQHENLASTNAELKAKNDVLGLRMTSLDKDLIEKQQRIIELKWQLEKRALENKEEVDI